MGSIRWNRDACVCICTILTRDAASTRNVEPVILHSWNIRKIHGAFPPRRDAEAFFDGYAQVGRLLCLVTNASSRHQYQELGTELRPGIDRSSGVLCKWNSSIMG